MLLSGDRSDATGSQPLSYEIIEAVAEREGIDATELEPPEYEALYDVINPEALDALFEPRNDGTERARGHVEFTYCGYDVVVTSEGAVRIED